MHRMRQDHESAPVIQTDRYTIWEKNQYHYLFQLKDFESSLLMNKQKTENE